MANTYTQLYTHLVFPVAHRECLIRKSFQDELLKYITGIIKNKKHKPLAINSVPDHIHILIGLNPEDSISSLVWNIKKSSTDFINEKKFLPVKFNWQKGFGGFSYSKSQISKVINYIQTQEEHHKRENFREEYIKMLKDFEIVYNEKYLFTFFD